MDAMEDMEGKGFHAIVSKAVHVPAVQ